MFKIHNNQAPKYVQSIFDNYKTNFVRIIRNPIPFNLPNIFAAKFLSSPVITMMTIWNKTPQEHRNLPTLSQLKSNIASIPARNKILSTLHIKNLNRKEELCLNRLRADLILKGQLYSHNFRSILDPRCDFCHSNVSTRHFLIQCQKPSHKLEIARLNAHIASLDLSNFFNNLNILNKCNFLLFGDNSLNYNTNIKLITGTAKFITANFNKL